MCAETPQKQCASTQFRQKPKLLPYQICRPSDKATLCLKPAAAFRCVIFHSEQKRIMFPCCTLGYFSRGEICLANAYGLFPTDVLSLGFIFATNHLRSVGILLWLTLF